MSWANKTIELLQLGKITQCRPHGNSMVPIILSGQLITLDPNMEPEVGKAVLCRCNGSQYVHLVKAIEGKGETLRFQIGNNRGRINGWVARDAIYGVVTKVED